VLPFSIELRPGLPVAEQIMFAVRKAVVGGQLRPGDKFPSVRALSQELKVNPNTAHKVIAALVAEGVLVTTPAVGSIVAERELGGRKERAALLGVEVEWLVVEAKKLGLELDDVQEAVASHWKKLGGK
jgi:GntR family transcriptional regulator